MIGNKQQNSILHALITKFDIDKEEKKKLVLKHTNGRESSSAKMLSHECQALINELNHISRQMPKNAQEESADNQRKKMCSIAREMGWVKENGKVDMVRLEKWVLTYGYKRYPKLNSYSVFELPRLITQFEYVLKHKVHGEG